MGETLPAEQISNVNTPDGLGMSVLALFLLAAVRAESRRAPDQVVLAIHGGAGALSRTKLSVEAEKEHRAVLEESLQQGYQILRRHDGTSLDAVEAAVRVLEDSPLYNAGKGSVFTHDGRTELDAAVMQGKDRSAGAVAGVTILKNPISAARAVMEKSEHVLLIGRGAELFATRQGLEIVDPSYFWTKERWLQLQAALREEVHPPKRRGSEARSGPPPDRHFGTVGAVALDPHGDLVAGTSTGGMTNKQCGRVGDSPIIGAGTYADNTVCAVSGTGHGEVFLRHAVAHDIAARMKYQGLSVQDAAAEVMQRLPKEPGGVGGVIALDTQGNLAMPFNTEGMYRGYVTASGKFYVAIYDD